MKLNYKITVKTGINIRTLHSMYILSNMRRRTAVDRGLTDKLLATQKKKKSLAF